MGRQYFIEQMLATDELVTMDSSDGLLDIHVQMKTLIAMYYTSLQRSVFILLALA